MNPHKKVHTLKPPFKLTTGWNKTHQQTVYVYFLFVSLF